MILETLREWRGLVDRTGWAAGPWDDEPDQVQWLDAATRLPCLLARGAVSGSLCGYVGLPYGNRFRRLAFNSSWTMDPKRVAALPPMQRLFAGRPKRDAMDNFEWLEVHGGVTWAGEFGVDVWRPSGPGDFKRLRFVGFDTAHAFDVMPTVDAIMAKVGDPQYFAIKARLEAMATESGAPRDRYRDRAYCQAEVERMALQLRGW